MAEITFSYPMAPKSIGGFVIDAFIREGYSFKNSATDIPVEEGSRISDHVVEEPLEIQISGFIGKAEMRRYPTGEFAVWEGPLPETQADINVPDPKARIRDAHFELLRLKSARQPIDVVTGLDTYPNMVITSYDIDRSVETGADLPFEMALKQIKVVKSETTTVNASRPSADQTAGEGNMGVAGTNQPNQQSNRMKEEWRQSVQMGLATPAEYQQKWGVPYPQ